MIAHRLQPLLAFLVLAAASALQADANELRVFTLKHRLAAELVSAVQPLLGPGESVNGVDNKLIVRAAPRTHAQVERLLAELDAPRRNLRISVRLGEARDASRQSGDVSGDIRSGNTRIVVGGDRPPDTGMTVRRSGPEGNIQLHTERRVTTASDSAAYTLTVMDGGRAFVRIGESVPQVETFLVFAGPHLGAPAAGVRFHDVTTGFEVEPRTIGERIQLTIHPRLAFRSDRGIESVTLREMRTEVIVMPGEWVDLGGTLESASEVNRRILGSARRTGTSDSRFLVRVDPL